MSAPWMSAGMVHDTAERLYENYRESVSQETGIIYAAALGMINSLADDATMTLATRMARIRDVRRAVDFALARVDAERAAVTS